ncbi:MAG: CapA family protein [Gaiella sp.]
MRGPLLVLRAGAVVVAIGWLASLMIDKAPEPAAAQRTTTVRITPVQKPPPPPAKPPRAFVSIVAVGDTVLGTSGSLPPNGGRTFFDGVRADLAGDVVLGNLEGTLTTASGSKCGAASTNCFSFRMPPSYGALYGRAGFTVLNLANNHAYDYGSRGLKETIAAVRRHGMLTTGRPGQIAIQTVGRTRVAIVGFSTYPWSASMEDLAEVKRLVRRAREVADIVIATAHMGAEGLAHQRVPRKPEVFLGERRGNPRAFAHAAVDAGADLVVGHGPHVLRGMEWYRGRLIAYSLGNFGGYKVFSLDGLLSTSAILRVTLRDDGRFESGMLVPTTLAPKGLPALDPSGRALRVVRALSQKDFGRRAVEVGAGGALK